MWLLIIMGSLIPIWRYPPYEGGYNLWQLLTMRKDRPHITSEEAVQRARHAYQQGHFDTATGT